VVQSPTVEELGVSQPYELELQLSAFAEPPWERFAVEARGQHSSPNDEARRRLTENRTFRGT
jgi:hypothetical protein